MFWEHPSTLPCVKWYSRVGSSLKLCRPLRWCSTPPSWSRTPYSRASARPAHRPLSISQSTRSLPWNTHSKWGCGWGGLEARSCWRRWCAWLDRTWEMCSSGRSESEVCSWCSFSGSSWGRDGSEHWPQDWGGSWVWWTLCRSCTSWFSCSWGSTSECRCWGWWEGECVKASSSCPPPPPNLSLSEEGFTCRSAHTLPWATGWWYEEWKGTWPSKGKQGGIKEIWRKKRKEQALIKRRKRKK